MKKYYLIFLFVALSLFMVACRGDNSGTTYVPEPSYSVDQIASICRSDTVHNKVFIFATTSCYGCSDYLGRVFKDALLEIDTSKWKIYCVSCDKICDKDEQIGVTRYYQKYGIQSDCIFFLNDNPYEEVLQAFVDLFRKVPDTVITIDPGVPKAYCVDRHGFLAITKSYDSESLDHYQYVARRFDKAMCTDEDFSKEYKGYYIDISLN